ncbi:MAG TPA: ATP-binding protein, partial [Candidatus Eisenbacteria bacterium]
RSIRLHYLALVVATVTLSGLAMLVMPAAAALLVGLMTGLGGAWWLAAGIAAPLEDLALRARGWAEGTIEQLPPRHGGGDEVDAVTAVLANLGTLLEAREGSQEHGARQLRQILETMVEGVMVLAPDGRVTLENAAMRRLVGTTGPLAGRTAIEALRISEFEAAARDIQAGGPAADLELVLDAVVSLDPREAAPMGAASRRTFRVSLAPLAVEQGRSVVAVFHDISQVRELENLRRDFVANVSHELRTPLTAIKGYVETLRDGEIAPADRERFLDIVARHSNRLSVLIEDLLELSRLESPETRLDIRPNSLPAAAQRALALLDGAAHLAEVTLVSGMPADLPAVVADARSLEQILINLLDNAIKHTGKGGRVMLSASRQEGRVLVSVADTGIGIPAHALPRVFERFYRVDQGRSREHGGTGLGLAIVKHLVALHGGEVGVESEPGKGSRFWFTLRVAGSEPAVAIVTESSPGADRSVTESA